jgi:hypothetical protein
MTKMYTCVHTRRFFSRSPCQKSAVFLGIIIRMYCELGPHHAAHFHAYYGGEEAVFGLDPIELLAGSLPPRQTRLVIAWAELHQQELVADWNRLQDGEEPWPIRPLQ